MGNSRGAVLRVGTQKPECPSLTMGFMDNPSPAADPSPAGLGKALGAAGPHLSSLWRGCRCVTAFLGCCQPLFQQGWSRGEFTESGNGSGWKGALKVSSSNPPAVSRDISNQPRMHSQQPGLADAHGEIPHCCLGKALNVPGCEGHTWSPQGTSGGQGTLPWCQAPARPCFVSSSSPGC